MWCERGSSLWNYVTKREYTELHNNIHNYVEISTYIDLFTLPFQLHVDFFWWPRMCCLCGISLYVLDYSWIPIQNILFTVIITLMLVCLHVSQKIIWNFVNYLLARLLDMNFRSQLQMVCDYRLWICYCEWTITFCQQKGKVFQRLFGWLPNISSTRKIMRARSTPEMKILKGC